MYRVGVLTNFASLNTLDWTIINRNNGIYVLNNFSGDQFKYENI